MTRSRLVGGSLLASLILIPGAVAWAQQGLFVRPVRPRFVRPQFVRPIRPQRIVPPVNTEALRLLRRMVVSELSVPYIAHEAMIRADGPGAEHIVKSDPRQGIRREPVRGKGMVTLDNFTRVYKFRANGTGPVTSEQSRQSRQMEQKIQDLARRLRNGNLRADVVGQDTIAGRTTDIVQVSAPGAPGGTTRRFWIDRDTGLRLRTEEVDATGKVLSGSYYLSLDLSPQFAANDFTPPNGDAVPPQRPATALLDRLRFRTVDEAAKGGFPVTPPGYVPNGYALRQVEATRNGAQISLRYSNGLNGLSITLLRKGVPPRVRPFLRTDGTAFVPFPQGRNGLFSPGTGGTAYLLIGDLPENELRRIAGTLR